MSSRSATRRKRKERARRQEHLRRRQSPAAPVTATLTGAAAVAARTTTRRGCAFSSGIPEIAALSSTGRLVGSVTPRYAPARKAPPSTAPEPLYSAVRKPWVLVSYGLDGKRVTRASAIRLHASIVAEFFDTREQALAAQSTDANIISSVVNMDRLPERNRRFAGITDHDVLRLRSARERANHYAPDPRAQVAVDDTPLGRAVLALQENADRPNTHIAETTGVSYDTVKKARAELEAIGAIDHFKTRGRPRTWAISKTLV
jgi:hypothetical protein